MIAFLADTTIPAEPRPEWPELPPMQLPATGSSLVVFVVAGFVLLILGACAVRISKRLRP